jgi:hypothetical protein
MLSSDRCCFSFLILRLMVDRLRPARSSCARCCFGKRCALRMTIPCLLDLSQSKSAGIVVGLVEAARAKLESRI